MLRPKDKTDRERAIVIAKVLLKAPNIEPNSDIAVLAREFLRECGLSEC